MTNEIAIPGTGIAGFGAAHRLNDVKGEVTLNDKRVVASAPGAPASENGRLCQGEEGHRCRRALMLTILNVELLPGTVGHAIAPSMTLTERIRPRWEKRTAEEQAQEIVRTPLRRMAEARDQARVICFLASIDADFVTGVTIDVTGGIRRSEGSAAPCVSLSVTPGLTSRRVSDRPTRAPLAPSLNSPLASGQILVASRVAGVIEGLIELEEVGEPHLEGPPEVRPRLERAPFCPTLRE
jgi:hypothetical protein